MAVTTTWPPSGNVIKFVEWAMIVVGVEVGEVESLSAGGAGVLSGDEGDAAEKVM